MKRPLQEMIKAFDRMYGKGEWVRDTDGFRLAYKVGEGKGIHMGHGGYYLTGIEQRHGCTHGAIAKILRKNDEAAIGAALPYHGSVYDLWKVAA